MSLITFDKSKKAFFSASDIYKNVDETIDVCVSFFDKKIMSEFVKFYKPEIIDNLSSITNDFIIYKTKINNVSIAVYQSLVGAPACVMRFEEAYARIGFKKFILVGSCGCLDKKIEDESIIIPDCALRDEGTSYSYLKDDCEVKLDKVIVSKLSKTMKELGINYTTGKVWTTDAIFRETKNKIDYAKSKNAIAVDMECSAMAAVAKFRNVKFGQIFFAADNLGKDDYDIRSLLTPSKKLHNQIIPLALTCASKI